MPKKTCLIFQAILLIWFFLDMIGIYFGDGRCLVERSYADDGPFFLIYLACFVLFILKENIGKWMMAGWLVMWFLIQFLSHEWYTIFGCGIMGTLEGKIKYFSNTLHWTNNQDRYFPDVYHTILHILILLALFMNIFYIVSLGRKRKNNYYSFSE